MKKKIDYDIRAEREKREKMEAERQEALRPDRDRLAQYADRIMALQAEIPEVSDAKAKSILKETAISLHDLAWWLNEQSYGL